jgi:hypothetical protein
MGDFSADWLSLRAGFDSAARSVALERRVARFAADRGVVDRKAHGKTFEVVDLGAGSGNNYRHLASKLTLPIERQHWTLVDGDPDLLATVTAREACTPKLLDLAADLEDAIPEGTDLVTASALIDLVSEAWLRRLVARVSEVGAAMLIVLTYDGRIAWGGPGAPAHQTEPDPMDESVRTLVNTHQRGEKGFGAALGPDAPSALKRLAGADLLTERSDWIIGPDDAAMRAALVDGWAQAAQEIEPDQASEIEGWRLRRRESRAPLIVGHADQLLLPTS